MIKIEEKQAVNLLSLSRSDMRRGYRLELGRSHSFLIPSTAPCAELKSRFTGIVDQGYIRAYGENPHEPKKLLNTPYYELFACRLDSHRYIQLRVVSEVVPFSGPKDYRFGFCFDPARLVREGAIYRPGDFSATYRSIWKKLNGQDYPDPVKYTPPKLNKLVERAAQDGSLEAFFDQIRALDAKYDSRGEAALQLLENSDSLGLVWETAPVLLVNPPLDLNLATSFIAGGEMLNYAGLRQWRKQNKV